MNGLISGEGKEYLLYKDGEYTDFGEYITDDYLDDIELAVFNYKLTAGLKGKEVILDFYLYRNLIRQYNIYGDLLKEICLGGIEKRGNTFDGIIDGSIQPYRGNVFATNDEVYSFYYEHVTNHQLHNEKDKVIPELQIWIWEGYSYLEEFVLIDHFVNLQLPIINYMLTIVINFLYRFYDRIELF
ncbi:hypothetical protein [Bacteroides bouchesdurhonensis]|uniref:hypothetical protein n=1 Tax=Bacteroides bouchesdurhonensis TaxID=1841855 RepID=UPI00097F7347|nr:hypothetical protein [Bacteroides bouchesdurhonensis]